MSDVDLAKLLADVRVAIVHEWMTHYGGGVERVAVEVSRLCPRADHFALIHDRRGLVGTPLEGLPVKTSIMQRIPLGGKLYRKLLPVMPAAVEALDLSSYDLVISLSHAVVRGVLTTNNQLHITYLQARPLKYAYEDGRLYGNPKKSHILRSLIMTPIRVWDAVAAKRPDLTVANSQFVRDWYQHRHGVESEVVYPPVDVDLFHPRPTPGLSSYYVTVGRLEPYKRVDLIVEAFRQSGRKLVVAGDGSELRRLKEQASGSKNIEFVGRLNPSSVADLLAGSKAFVFASKEDFGIAPLEAQAMGVPVIAFAQGGAAETIISSPRANATGLLYGKQTAASLNAAVERFEDLATSVKVEDCVRNARRFSSLVFRQRFGEVVGKAWLKFSVDSNIVL